MSDGGDDMELPSHDDFERLFINNSKLDRISAYLNRFNPIRVMRMEQMEIRHSAILAWLLDPRESHGLGDAFLKAFLSGALRGQAQPGFPTALDIARQDLSGMQVQCERGHMDILLHHPALGFAVIIENKFRSKQRNGQLARYMDNVHSVLGVNKDELAVCGIFLTLNEEPPDHGGYVAFSYSNVGELLSAIMLRDARLLTAEVRIFLTHYLDVIEEELGMSTERNEIEKLARDLYREHQKLLDFIMEHGPTSDFIRAIDALAGEDPHLQNAVRIDGQLIHFAWTGFNMASFLPSSWYEALGEGDLEWAGCERWWSGFPVICWFQLFENREGAGGQLRLYGEVGPIADHRFRKSLIEAIQDAAEEEESDKIRFQGGATDEGRRFSKFFKQNTVSIKDVQDADEIAVAAKKLLKSFKPEFKLIGDILPNFRKYGKSS